MQVSIEFLGNQYVITRTDSIDMPIMERTTVREALEYVRQRYPELPLPQGVMVIIVNKAIASPGRILRDHDTISFLPPISGG